MYILLFVPKIKKKILDISVKTEKKSHNSGYVTEFNYFWEILVCHFYELFLEIDEMQFFITDFIILSFQYSLRDTVVALVAFFL